MSKQIVIDMDGVMADVYAKFVSFEEEKLGRKLDLKSIEGLGESKAFSSYREALSSAGFFETAPVMEGCVEALEYLNSRNRIFIVSAATEYPNSMKEKMNWLELHFPFISWRQIVFCGVKDFMRGDVIIDDHMRHLDSFLGGEKILFSQPHNINDNKDGVVRGKNWAHIKELLS